MQSDFVEEPEEAEKSEVIDALFEIRDALTKLLGNAPSVNVAAPAVHLPAPKVEVPVTVSPAARCGWSFEVTERDKAGYIKKFTAVPEVGSRISEVGGES